MQHVTLTTMSNKFIIGTMGRCDVKPDEGDSKVTDSPKAVLDQNLSPLGLAVLTTLPVGVVLFDKTLHPQFINRQAGRLLTDTGSLDMSLSKCVDADTGPPEGWTALLKKTLDTGEGSLLEGVALVSAGKVRWLRITITRVETCTAASSGPSGMLTIEDMGQLTRARQQLDHNERLAALGKLTSKVAHELNSPLDGILRYINLTTRAIEQQRIDKSQEYLDRCREGLSRMVRIVGELLQHARHPRKRNDTAPLGKILEEALHTVAAKSQAEQIEVVISLCTDLPDLRIANLYQIFSNVVRNAYEAMPQGGKLTISAVVKDNCQLNLDFCDTGSGIASEDLQAVFDPFFTTKDGGTGLGLAVCRDIITGLGGTITANNEVSGGIAISIKLPLDRIT
ncbi:nitrogen regulation protein NR(II) [Planctomycetota bacterium]